MDRPAGDVVGKNIAKMANPKQIRLPSKILTPEVIERLLGLLGAGRGVLHALKELEIRPRIYFHHRARNARLRRRIEMVVQNRREQEGQRRFEEHLRQKEERKRLRRILRGPPKPKPGRQAKLMAWAIGVNLPLHYGYRVPVEFEQEWCEKFDYSLREWHDAKARFPQLMAKAFAIIRGRMG